MCKVRSPLPGVWLPGKVHARAYTAASTSFPQSKYVHLIPISGRKHFLAFIFNFTRCLPPSSVDNSRYEKVA